MTLGNGSRS